MVFYRKKGGVKKSGTVVSNLEHATYLVIVESPSKCAKIENYLGPDYCCIASKGHIRHIDGLKSINTKEGFEPTFTIMDTKAEHVEWMRGIIEKFSKPNIILASDDDREGEAIAWHICQVFGLPIDTTPRIKFHEITKPAVKKAIETPERVNMKLVQAQLARQVLDIIVGYKISPHLWTHLYNSKTNSLSAGRCQTPALRLVYENEMEKKKSGGMEYRYKTRGIFFLKNVVFELDKEMESKDKVLEFLTESTNFPYQLTVGPPKSSTRSAPKPFHTSRLLQYASNVLHMSPTETMSHCQTLYQGGYITYMRTESSNYARGFLDQVRDFILNEWQYEKYVGNLDVLENKDSANPHEAIRVTQLQVRTIDSMEDKRMAALYALIWKNTVQSCMADAKYECSTIKITAPQSTNYVHVLEIPGFLGWKVVDGKADVTNNSMKLYFQSLVTKFSHNRIESEVVARNKHQHYSEAGLIQELEDRGIGRPSTFAQLIETIQDRGYVKKMDIEGEQVECENFVLADGNIQEIVRSTRFGGEKQKLVIQNIGILAVEFLIAKFGELFEYEYTKHMEGQLDKISSGQVEEWSSLCNACHSRIKILSKAISAAAKLTFPLANGPEYEFAYDKYGPVIRKQIGDGETIYISVRKDIVLDLEKLRAGGYAIEELMETKERLLGKHEDMDLYIRSGPHGLYLEWGEQKRGLKNIESTIETITIAEAIEHITASTQVVDKNILRKLTEFMSIRKGKYGPYIFFQRPDMTKPQFLNIKKFKGDYWHCPVETLVSWLCETYSLEEKNLGRI